MIVAVNNKFNNGNGGSSIEYALPSGPSEITGAFFVDSARSVEIALDLLRGGLPAATFTAVKQLIETEPPKGRVVVPMKWRK